MQVTCPRCRATRSCPDDLARQKLWCPRCGQALPKPRPKTTAVLRVAPPKTTEALRPAPPKTTEALRLAPPKTMVAPRIPQAGPTSRPDTPITLHPAGDTRLGAAVQFLWRRRWVMFGVAVAVASVLAVQRWFSPDR